MKAVDMILVSKVSNRTDGTYTVTLQHSRDSITWHDVVTLSAQSADGEVIDTSLGNLFEFIRAKVVAATVTTGATLDVRVYYRQDF